MNIDLLPKSAKAAKKIGSRFYFTGKACVRGHLSKRSTLSRTCIDCNGKWGKENIEKKRVISNRYYKNNYKEIKSRRSDYFKDYVEINCERIAIRKQEYYKNNNERINNRNAIYRKNNLDKYRAFTANYRAIKLKATPAWLSKDDLKLIERFYTVADNLSKNMVDDYHVDHMIPLQGKLVCGLHVPWNLQVITQTENLSKSNKILLEYM